MLKVMVKVQVKVKVTVKKQQVKVKVKDKDWVYDFLRLITRSWSKFMVRFEIKVRNEIKCRVNS